MNLVAADKGVYWLKELKCPNCDCRFQTTQIKSRAYQVVKREPDFYVEYAGIVPWLYEVAACPVCAFSGESKSWKELAVVDKRGLDKKLKEVRPLDLSELCGERSYAAGIQAFQLAYSSYEFANTTLYVRGNLALKGSFLARAAREKESAVFEKVEQDFREKALELFIKSFEYEHTENTKYGSNGIAYVIGELERQRGEFRQAVNWFSRALMDKKCPPVVAKLARTQWERARAQYRQSLGEPQDNPSPQERTADRVVLNIYKDQSDFLDETAKKTGLSRQELIRALFDAIKDSGLDWRNYRSADAVAKLKIKAESMKIGE